MNPTIQDDPRLSAWLLDEMSVSERAEFDQLLAESSEDQAFADEMRMIASGVGAAFAAEPEYRLTELQRARVFDPPATRVAAPEPLSLDDKVLPWKRLRHTGDVTEKIRMTDRMESRRKTANFPTYAVCGMAAAILAMLVVGSFLFFRDEAPLAKIDTKEPEVEEVAISIHSPGESGPTRPSRGVGGSTATGYAFRDPSQAEFRRSSFGLKPGSASYQAVSNGIRSGLLPSPMAVRVEEMINYFIYDYPEPEEEQSMSVSVESAPCPWEPEHQLVQIGLKGREADEGDAPKQNVATDIDVQVEFDPAAVKEYRLIGYETSKGETVAATRNDPSREFAAGDATTALYEVVPADANVDENSLLTVHLNYNEPADKDGKIRARVLASTLAFSEHKRWSDTTSDFRFAASVAGFGMKLRDQDSVGGLDFKALEDMADKALNDGKDKPRRKRFVDLIQKTQKLVEGK